MDPLVVENLNTLLEQDMGVSEKIKEQVKELDKKVRTIVGILGKIHSTPSNSSKRVLDSSVNKPHFTSNSAGASHLCGAGAL